jgi:hypothetical protein
LTRPQLPVIFDAVHLEAWPVVFILAEICAFICWRMPA